MARQGMSDLAIRNWFIIPTIVFLIAFNVFPLIYSLGFSFTDYRASSNRPVHVIGLQNYQELLADDGIWNNFTITAKYVVLSVAGQVLVGFGMALLLNRPIPGKGLLTTILMLPMMMSAAVVGLFWQLLYNPSWGIVNYLLRSTALIQHNVDWYGSPDFALTTIIIADVWKTTPFMALLLLAGLQTIPGSLSEASIIDGANAWQRFWYVRLPLLAPTLLIASMFRALDAFRIFDLVYVLTGGGPADSTEVLSTLTYKNLFSALQVGYGSSLSTMMFITEILIAAIFGLFLLRKMKDIGQ